MRITYQFPYPHNLDLDLAAVAEVLVSGADDAAIELEVRTIIAEHLMGDPPSPQILGMSEIIDEVRERLANRKEDV